MKHELPKLTYAYNALEPYIDAQTMELHHSKHHQTYVTKLNEALDKHPELYELELSNLLADLDKVPEDIRTAVRNHGGGHFNHSLFWKLMSPAPQTTPTEKLAELINATFGSYDKFKEKFTTSALAKFGSGWTWLVIENGALEIVNTDNQDSPISHGQKVLMGIDVWEHAYYLKYQNLRADYIANWWNVLDWAQVDKNL